MARKHPLPIVGDEQGKLKIRSVHPAFRGCGYRTYLVCDCKCGNTNVKVNEKEFRSGNTASCGCTHHRRKDRSTTAEFRAWYGIVKRCTDPKHKAWNRYGGRGIKVCERWLQSFDAFLEDMGARPSNDHSVGRKKNDGDYEPDNCRWETRLEQGNNKSNNRMLTHRDKTMTLAEWSRETGIPRARITMRLRDGWSIGRTLDTVGDARK